MDLNLNFPAAYYPVHSVIRRHFYLVFINTYPFKILFQYTLREENQKQSKLFKKEFLFYTFSTHFQCILFQFMRLMQFVRKTITFPIHFVCGKAKTDEMHLKKNSDFILFHAFPIHASAMYVVLRVGKSQYFSIHLYWKRKGQYFSTEKPMLFYYTSCAEKQRQMKFIFKKFWFYDFQYISCAEKAILFYHTSCAEKQTQIKFV